MKEENEKSRIKFQCREREGDEWLERWREGENIYEVDKKGKIEKRIE